MGQTVVSKRNERAKKFRWLKQGRCWVCGELKRDPNAAMCDFHGIQNRERYRKKLGMNKFQQPGKYVYREVK